MSILVLMVSGTLIGWPLEAIQAHRTAHRKAHAHDKYQRVHRSRRHKISPSAFHRNGL